MIWTIKQRIYVFGLLPLGTFAVGLVLSNGYARIDDANRELATARRTTAALLQAPAIGSLVLGNSLEFEQAVKAVMRTSPALRCVTLTDVSNRPVSRLGDCDRPIGEIEHFEVREPGKELLDYEVRAGRGSVVGALGLLMNDPDIVRKRQTIMLELGLSLIAIGGVLAMTGRSLRTRLITPIGRIGQAMQSVSARDYAVRVPVEGHDELTRLGEAINNTIATVAEYTRELEQRRKEADQALQDADAANLARDGLVRSLTEDLAEPMALMHARLTAMALANTHPALREDIKQVMALLQDAQSDFTDLMEIATHIEHTRSAPWLDIVQVWDDIDRDIRRLSATEAIPVNFVVSRTAQAEHAKSGLLVNIDGVRLKKAMLYVVRALGRRGETDGVHVSAELIKFSSERLHLSVRMLAFGSRMEIPNNAAVWVAAVAPNGGGLNPAIGLTDRESKIVDYLLRAIGATSTVSVSRSGTVNMQLGMECGYSVEGPASVEATDWMFAARPITAVLVSNDASLLRYTTRGDMSNHELKLLSFNQAITAPNSLLRQDALLVDISDDMAEVMKLLGELKEQGQPLAPLIAICPPGVVTEALTSRLFDLGFVGMVHKPLQYSRLIEVIRTTLTHPLENMGRYT
jgi:HAMP domain-containing protein